MMGELKTNGSILQKRLGSSSRNAVCRELYTVIRNDARRFKDMSRMCMDLCTSVTRISESLDQQRKVPCSNPVAPQLLKLFFVDKFFMKVLEISIDFLALNFRNPNLVLMIE